MLAAQVTDGELHAYVTAWLAADRPLVVTRQSEADKGFPDTIAPDTVSVGLALPPMLGKRRITLSVALHHIARYTPPLRLADAMMHAPAAWQPALGELDAAAMNIELELRVFGSLAWQTLSGLPYLTPQSDIDLLWHPLSNEQLLQGITLLARWEQSSGLRADGEVIFGASSAVSWREWATSRSDKDQRVLVKYASGAELVDARELLELLA